MATILLITFTLIAPFFSHTVGAVSAETAKRYIEEGQTKHWTSSSTIQQTLFSYAN